MVKLTFMLKIHETWHTINAWVRERYNRAHKIFINFNLFKKQAARIKKVISWNGYIQNEIIKLIENLKNTKE